MPLKSTKNKAQIIWFKTLKKPQNGVFWSLKMTPNGSKYTENSGFLGVKTLKTGAPTGVNHVLMAQFWP